MKLRQFVVLLILSFFATAAGHADHFALFKAGKPIRNYNRVALELGPGDSVSFSNGEVFEIGKGHSIISNSSIFLNTADGKLLRIPGQNAEEKYRGRITSYIEGYPALALAGMKIPVIFGSWKSEYVLQERVEVISLLSRWKNRLEGDPLIMEELRKFLLSTWQFSHVGDFRSEQVAITPKGLVLLDWDDSHVKADSFFGSSSEARTIAEEVWDVVTSPKSRERLRQIHLEIQHLRKASAADCNDTLEF